MGTYSAPLRAFESELFNASLSRASPRGTFFLEEVQYFFSQRSQTIFSLGDDVSFYNTSRSTGSETLDAVITITQIFRRVGFLSPVQQTLSGILYFRLTANALDLRHSDKY